MYFMTLKIIYFFIAFDSVTTFPQFTSPNIEVCCCAHLEQSCYDTAHVCYNLQLGS